MADLAGISGKPAARAIEPVQDVDVRVKKSVAPSKRSHRCFFGIVSSDPHGGQNSPLWLIISCERGSGGRTFKPPSLLFSWGIGAIVGEGCSGLGFRTKAKPPSITQSGAGTNDAAPDGGSNRQDRVYCLAEFSISGPACKAPGAL